MIVAGGGGGAGADCNSSSEYGGAGGGLTGAIGWYCSTTSSCYCGSGGTQTAGGSGATCYGSTAGSLGTGGNGSYSYNYSGAGGGGYYGGGAGGYGGGGGGSSYTDATCTGVIHTQGYNSSSNGYVTITYTPSIETPCDGVSAFALTAATGSSLLDVFICTAASTTTGYLSRIGTVAPVTLYQGGTYASTITWGTVLSYQEAQVWIDFDNDGTFATSEEVSPVVGYNTTTTTSPTTFNISVPLMAATGNHNMRVRGILESSAYTQGLSTHLDPCLVQYLSTTPEYSNGDVLDYVVNITPPPACTGTPTAGTATVTPTNGSSSTTFTLSLSGTTFASSLTYQWQSSTDGTTWTNITGATTPIYSFSGLSANTYYKCIVACTGYSGTSISTSTQAFLLSCLPTNASWTTPPPTTTTYSYTGSVQTWTVPTGVTSIGVDMAGATGGSTVYGSHGGYGGRVQATLPVTPGTTLNVYVGGAGGNYTYSYSYASGGSTAGGNGGYYVGGGGGASDIRIGGTALSNRMIVAGGGGGAGADCNSSSEYGGAGGGLTGAIGWYCSTTSSCYCGSGGSQTAGGSGATCYGSAAGSLGTGGNGSYSYNYSGAGGGGYYGGGSGAYGGGGSSYTDASCIGVTHTQGYNASGNGYVTISYTPTSVIPCDGITSIYITPATGSALNDVSICSSVNTTTGYLNRIGTVAPVTLYQGGTYASSITWGTALSYQEAQIWIDYNNDGIFSTSEEVTPVLGYNTTTTTSPITFNIAIPLLAATGNHNMRVRGILESSAYTQGLSTHLDPCLVQYLSTTPEYSNGDVIDYVVKITPPPACAGTPTAGTATVTPTNGSSSTTFTLSLSGTTFASGLTYQWQSSPDGTTWTNITAATTAIYSFSGLSGNTFFQCIVGCSGYPGTSTSTSVEAILMACYPSSASWYNPPLTTTYSYTGSVQTWTVPSGITSINVDMAGATGGSTVYGSHGGYGGRVQATLPVTPGTTLNIYVGGAGGNYTYSYSYASGGSTAGGNGGYYVGGGGGASDIRIGGTALSNRMIVAGGGGGAGNDCSSSAEYGGAGGGLTGAIGWYCSTTSSCYCGSGGSQTAGGIGATCYGSASGSLGTGGNGTYSYYNSGAGGGGYYGGGAGGYGGGGGGSSYTDASCTGVTHTQGYNASGNGYVTIGYFFSGESPTYGINTIYVTPSIGSPLVDAFMTTSASTTSGYLDRTSVTPVSLYQGGTYATSLGWGTATSYQEAQIWIDFNNDGAFSTSEEVTPIVGYSTSSTPDPVLTNITIPSSAPIGNHLMRVRGILESSAYTRGLSTHLDPCLVQYLSTTPEYSNGNIIDYMVNIVPVTVTLGYLPVACASSSSSTISQTYSATTGAPNAYQLVWGAAAHAAGFTDVTAYSGTLPTAPGSFNITIPAGAPTNIYTGIFNAQNTTTGAVSVNYTITLVVNAAPTATVTNNGPVCAGSTVNLVATPSGGVTSYAWSGSNLSSSTLQNPTATPTATATYSLTVSSGTGPGCSPTTTYTTTVTVVPYPAAAISGSPLTFCAGSSVTLNATPTGSYTYQWKNAGGAISGATNASYTANLTGNYSVTITPAAASCSSTSPTTTVNVVSFPIPAISGTPLSLCAGSSVTLNATPTGPYTYQWGVGGAPITGATNATYSTTSSGNYSVTVTPIAASCPSTSPTTTVNVVPFPTPAISGTPLTFCAGSTVTLNATPTGSYTYQWGVGGTPITGATNATYSANTSGNYSVTVTPAATSCASTSATTTVNVVPFPTPAISGTPLTFCAGSTVTLNASPTGSYTYQWGVGGTPIAGATNATYSANTSGNYSVTVTPAATSCASTSATTTVNVVPFPTPAISGTPLTFCAGSSVTLNASPTGSYTYQWGVGGTPISGATNSTYTANTTGNYSVTVSPISVSCPATSSTTTVNVIPYLASTITASGPTTFCAGSNVTLSASPTGSYTYQWGNSSGNISGATNATYSAVATDNYTVVVTPTVTSCPYVSTATSVTVVPYPSPSIAGSPLSFCAGSSVTLNATPTGSYTYQWGIGGAPITGATNATYSTTSSGNYSVTVTPTVASCPSTSPTTTVNAVPFPTPAISGSPLTICAGSSVTLNATPTGSYTYQWVNDGGTISGATNATYAANASGNYSVTVTPTAASCPSTSATTTISVASYPTASISAGGDTTFCSGSNVTLSATPTGAYTYQWYRSGSTIAGATNTTFTANTTGSYSVTITPSAASCPNTSSATSVTVDATPDLGGIAASATSVCAGNAVTLSETGTPSVPSTGTNIYTWSGPTGIIGTVASISGSSYFSFIPSSSSYSGIYTLSALTAKRVAPLPML